MERDRAKKLFGTDGIRGIAGRPPLDDATVYAVGAALGRSLEKSARAPRAWIGMDTRESGPGIAAWLAGGLRQAGVEVDFAGVVTTPAVAYLTRQGSHAAGVMVSASHNPYEDNGIKIFGSEGYKLSDAVEARIEAAIEEQAVDGMEPRAAKLARDETALDRYLDYLAGFWRTRNAPRVLVDCAHGAASEAAPRLFRRLGVEAEFLACSPDGRNINRGCGSLHMRELRGRVAAGAADLGIAFDGDADRALFAAENGDLVDGDAVLLLAAEHLAANGRLAHDTVVTTVMANMGLAKSLGERGISMARTPVGDRHVLEEMRRRGAVLGGEQSGHVIFADAATTGDGLLTACRMIEIVAAAGEPLSRLAARLALFPQTLRNIRVRRKPALEEVPAIAETLARSERELDGRGRIVVRYSGTEPLARVMVEAEDPAEVERHASALVRVIEEHLGA